MMCTFCCGKSCVAHLQAVTVPKLELTAATIAAKLCNFICRELEYEFDCVKSVARKKLRGGQILQLLM